MTESETILELLAAWEEQRRLGKTPTAADLCPDDPHLRDKLQARMQKRQRMENLLALPQDTEPGMSTTELPPPKIAGFEILDLVGRGGMGVVYRARQQGLNRLVALKIISAGASAGPQERKRFRSEAEAVASLKHPNIVDIHAIGEESGCPYLALEWVPGGSLAEHLKPGPLPAERAAQLVRALAGALAYAHEKGIVHRDLKPANVLIALDGSPKIADFGLAKRLGEDLGFTQTGAVLGSPSYMAPEQAAGDNRAIGPATDVYALGAILYELLTGRPPFLSASLMETLEQVRQLDPVPPHVLQPSLPRDLETICLKCLEKNPAHRYASAADLQADLHAYLSGEPITARSLTLIESVGRVIKHTQLDANLSRIALLMLAIAPVPFLIHLTLFLWLRDTPNFPMIMVATTIATVSLFNGLIMLSFMPILRRLPGYQRRQHLSVWMSFQCTVLLYPLLLWLVVAPERPDHWLVLYPLIACLAANTFLALASHMGIYYIVGFVCYSVALTTALVPHLAPLLVSTVMSINMFSQGLFFRRFRKQS